MNLTKKALIFNIILLILEIVGSILCFIEGGKIDLKYYTNWSNIIGLFSASFFIINYIIKENFIITLIGIVIGLIISKPFVDFIVDSIEIDLVEFVHNINGISYLLSFGFMILFTLIVSIIIHFILRKIDMIESLKSVE